MELTEEQVKQFVSYISVSDIKNFMEQYPTEYQYFLQNEIISNSVPIIAKTRKKPNMDFYILE